MAKRSKLVSIYRVLLYAMPAVLYFSFWPWISFGSNSTMNFDLSLPLIWLVVFDIVACILIIKNGLIKKVLKSWVWLLLPGYLTISVLWSHDKLRSLLIIGVLWLVYIAVFAFVLLKKYIADEKFWRRFLKIFFGVGMVVCGWCVLQCIMDVAGVPRNCTLLCSGCVYRIFGFPHPNGFAAEPQFMGNLLLAPIFATLYLLVKNRYFSRKVLLVLFFIFVATLFLTLSRGAIYGFAVAMVVFTIIYATKKTWKIMWIWGVVIFAFLCTLNFQGILSEVSKTNDTYVSGMSKVINQLTLGVIDVGGSQVKKEDAMEPAEDENANSVVEEEDGAQDEEKSEQAAFDGYVEISTSSRVGNWQSAIRTWKKDPIRMIFGAGVGGELVSMYENGEIDSSREIINNQYVSVLLEGGIVGVVLCALTLVMLFWVIRGIPDALLIYTLVIAYAVTLVFFSGLPNALHVYLLPVIFVVFCEREQQRSVSETRKTSSISEYNGKM